MVSDRNSGDGTKDMPAKILTGTKKNVDLTTIRYEEFYGSLTDV